MTSSSYQRRRAAMIPWVSALVLAATAHLGWLVHDLSSEHVDAHASVARERPCCPATVMGSEPAAARVTVDCQALAQLGPDRAARALGLPGAPAVERDAGSTALAVCGLGWGDRADPALESTGSRSIASAIAYEDPARTARRAHERRQRRVLRRVHRDVGGHALVGRTPPDP